MDGWMAKVEELILVGAKFLFSPLETIHTHLLKDTEQDEEQEAGNFIFMLREGALEVDSSPI